VVRYAHENQIVEYHAMHQRTCVHGFRGYHTRFFEYAVNDVEKQSARPDLFAIVISCNKYIHTTRALSLKGYQRHLRYSSDIPPRRLATFYQNTSAVRNTAEVTGGNPIAVYLRYIF
jgi:hypothetical protein